MVARGQKWLKKLNQNLNIVVPPISGTIYCVLKGVNYMFIIKRDGTKVPFDKDKIIRAINGAMVEVDGKV